MGSQFIPSPLPPCSHYEQPGIIVPPPTTASLSLPGQNPTPSTSPCQECAIHHTILQSMGYHRHSMEYPSCQHLQANPSCSSCCSKFQMQHHGISMAHNQGNYHVFQTQCGHVQQHYNPYIHRNDTQVAGLSTPIPQYNTWTQHPISTQQGHVFIPPTTDLAPPPSSAPYAISLTSPSVAMTQIPSFHSDTDLQSRSYNLTVTPDLSPRGGETDPLGPRNQQFPHNIAQLGVPPHSSEIEMSRRSSGSESLNGLSNMRITDTDTTNREVKTERQDSTKRKIQKVPSDKRKSNSEKRSLEVRKRQPEDLCAVCGDKASGYHYNALTCEGCKGFFRRSITNKATYKQGCKQGGNCEMDTYTRRKCPHCRLKKCKEVGMLEECLLTEIQCQSKRRRRKQKQQQEKQREEDELKIDETSQSTNVTSPGQSSVASSPSGSEGSQNGDAANLLMTEEENKLIATVAEAFEHYNIKDELVQKWEEQINKDSKPTYRLSDITTVHVQVLVEFAKTIPGFATLDPEDQIALLKGSVFEAMLLRNSCGFHHLRREINKSAILDELGIEAKKFEALLEFFNCIGKLGMDEVEYALLIAIVIFNSDYPFVKNKSRVEECQDMYLNALAKYSLTREPIRPSIFARILAMLTEIRSLSHYNAEVVTSWKKRGALTPLLCEIWDLD